MAGDSLALLARFDVAVPPPTRDRNGASGVTERQRELARWLIEHGADAIAGSHPHCIQAFDSYRGRPIIYSLGNLVFDGAPTLPSWNRGQLVAFDLGGPRPLFHLVPVQLDQGVHLKPSPLFLILPYPQAW